MAKKYNSEREGQLDFFDKYNIRYDTNENEDIVKDNTDGIYLGGIFEFKLSINDLNKVLFQTIKYLSRERVKGHNVPLNIFLIDLNRNISYIFKSSDYFKEIHKIYTGASSKQNEGFINKNPNFILNLSKPEDDNKFRSLILKKDFLSIDIDENCIVGWAERYYKENPEATKDDFLKDDGELRKPNKFKNLINPYTKETNERFKYLMDLLNDKFKKKKLGAFYTPTLYSQKSAELVREAITRVPEGNDYIILDRCAGTGNLESVLTDEELSHCVLSTYEYYEWLVLKERFEDKVRKILPENGITFENGFVKENDAMSETFVKNPYLEKYINDPKCTIIILENPPFSDETSNGNGKAVLKDNSFVLDEMKKEVTGNITNELANRFIWSIFKFYLPRKDGFAIIFSPIKYWKGTNQIINKEYIKGFIFNRKHFHASESAITCILFSGKDANIDLLKDLEIIDIDTKNNSLKTISKINIPRVKKPLSQLYDNREFANDSEDGICCEFNGTESFKDAKKIRTKKLFNKNIIGYMRASSFNMDNLSFKLLRCAEWDANGFFLRDDNYIKKLPLGVTKLFLTNSDNWYDDIFYTTSDGGNKFEKDKLFLKSSLIFIALSQHNKILSFKGSDGRDYKNEISFDKLSKYKPKALLDIKKFSLNVEEKSLISLWDKIITKASKTSNYNKNYTYGLYQIIKELNTFKDENGKLVYDYPDLNGDINSLKIKLKTYYKKYIEPKCFKYELLK
jgi:hypothetical protein